MGESSGGITNALPDIRTRGSGELLLFMLLSTWRQKAEKERRKKEKEKKKRKKKKKHTRKTTINKNGEKSLSSHCVSRSCAF